MTRRSWLAISALALLACGPAAPRRGATVLYASGADLQSINPLLTVHPLARQVQRYVLLTTLVRYDSVLQPAPYLARRWAWSLDRQGLFFTLRSDLRWSDGRPTTARDAAWTLEAARDPATGYPRLSDLSDFTAVSARDDSTLVIRFSKPQLRLPDVLTDLAILPHHLLDSVPHAGMRQASWNQHPVGNGPFRFVLHEPNRRWVFESNRDFPAALGGPPRLTRFIVVVVDEPTTKLAALTSGELDFAGINPAHAEFVRRNPELAVLDYPILFSYGIVFNTRRRPFNDLGLRRRISNLLDRKEIVDGNVYGFGSPADGPVAKEVERTGPNAVPPSRRPTPSAPPVPTASTASTASFDLLTVGSGEAALEQLIQAQLARGGIEVSIRQMELSAYLDRVYGPSHDFEAAVLGVPGDLGLGYLQSLAGITGLTVPTDPAGALQVFADSVPVAFLYHARGVQGMNRRVKGVVMDLRGELVTVHEWWVDGGR